MNNLDNLVFTTKSILLTDKQKETIESLLDTLTDLGCESFDNIEYKNLSKQDASKLISKMLDKIEDIEYTDEQDLDFDFDPLWDVGDND